MRAIVLAIVALFLAWLEVDLLGHVEYHGIAPDLLLIYVVFVSMSFPLESAVVAGGLLGILKDMCSALPLGTFSLLFTFAALLASVARNYFFKQSVPAQLVVVFLTAFAVHGLCGAALTLTGAGYTWDRAFFRALEISVYTALCAPVLLFLLNRSLARFLPASARRR